MIVTDCVTLPDAPVTTTCELPAGVGVTFGPLCVPPPHPAATAANPIASQSPTSAIADLGAAAGLAATRRHSIARNASGRRISKNNTRVPGHVSPGLVTSAPLSVVVIVRFVITVEPCGFTEAGENWHPAPAGNPEQENDTLLLKLGTAATEIEIVADCPAVTVALDAEADIAYGAAFVPTIWVKGAEMLGW